MHCHRRYPRPLPRAATLAAVCVALLFGAPHLVIPAILGAERPYTPFAVDGVSALTYDETFAYASQVNYTLLRWLPAYDTDTYEARSIPSPLAVAPVYFLAALAHVAGGVERAFILSDFLLPAVAFVLLYLLLFDLTGRVPLSLLGATVILLVPFGPRTFLRTLVDLLTTGTTSTIQPLEYSRLLHPQLSFTLLLGALLLLWRTVRGGSPAVAAGAGVAGGLLFYTYVYYWPIWVGACALLLGAAVIAERRRLVALTLVNALTWLISIPFWIILVAAYRTPNFQWFLSRFVSAFGQGHSVPLREQLIYTSAYVVSFALMLLVFCKYGTSPDRTRIAAFLTSLFVAGLVAMNSDLVSGVDLETMIHFPNRFFQPFLLLVCFACLLPVFVDRLPAAGLRRRAYVALAAYAGMALLLAGGAARQVAVAQNVAPWHAYRPDHRSLFTWLAAHTGTDDVVAASDRYVNTLLPVYTPDRPFVPSGGRSTISSEEIERRYLIAMKLLGHDAEAVRQILAQKATGDDPAHGFTYSYYLFQAGYGQVDRGLPEDQLTRIAHRYRELDLARELGRWRLDYVYVGSSETLQPVPGWRFEPVAETSAGEVWRVRRDL